MAIATLHRANKIFFNKEIASVERSQLQGGRTWSILRPLTQPTSLAIASERAEKLSKAKAVGLEALKGYVLAEQMTRSRSRLAVSALDSQIPATFYVGTAASQPNNASLHIWALNRSGSTGEDLVIIQCPVVRHKASDSPRRQ